MYDWAKTGVASTARKPIHAILGVRMKRMQLQSLCSFKPSISLLQWVLPLSCQSGSRQGAVLRHLFVPSTKCLTASPRKKSDQALPDGFLPFFSRDAVH